MSRQDALIAIVLAAVVGLVSYHGATRLSPTLLRTTDVWFESDLVRVYDNMTDRWSNHYRTKVHPLFSLVAYPLVYPLRKLVGFDPVTATRVFTAIVAGIWIVLLYAVLRVMSCRTPDAALFALLTAVSAGVLFWFVVPETYSLGSVTILSALLLAALSARAVRPEWQFVLVSAATLSMTVTNWMAGILTTWAYHPWRRTAQITVNAFCLVVVLWGAQKVLFPTAQFFLGDKEEARYTFHPEAGGVSAVARSFFAHSVVMPTFQAAPDGQGWEIHNGRLLYAWPRLSIQRSGIGSGGAFGWMSAALWLTLLALGTWSLITGPGPARFRIVLTFTLIGQFLLHLVYGNETFLYALHFVPLLTLVAAHSVLTAARPLALLLAGVLLLTALVNNGRQFLAATAFIQDARAELHAVRDDMQRRPADPWPRGAGHVVLAAAGTREVDKAYHEPGGSFSPSVGSFGVSFWITDSDGRLIETSDSLPLERIRQELSAGERGIPALRTDSPYYQARWSSPHPGRWTLTVRTQQRPGIHVLVVIRSVGPAGGPVRDLAWTGSALTINHRWTVTMVPAPATVALGEEGSAGWITERRTNTEWSGTSGWGYARLDFGSATDWHLEIVDGEPPDRIPTLDTSAPPLIVDVPDPRFNASLEAQFSHIQMGLVGRETRPGDPMNYPLAWLRDGAYEVVALARAGKLDLAETLSHRFAEQDFFGGFGPEADAPGMAIWALEEVAVRLQRPEYDRLIWPHVQRKAEWIERMLAARKPIYGPMTGPLVPEMAQRPEMNLICDASRDGLIVGRMDNHRPILFVNAVSYRGLLDAAALASRLGDTGSAERWRRTAAALGEAWERAFVPPESDNDRTYANGLWPTGIARAATDRFRAALQRRWGALRTADGGFRQRPLWTYFDVAEAHQWLLLGEPERTWATVRWFWDHQTSPGLYTWWEGDHAENSFHRWDRIRGWLSPPNVTPHYWTAAEMALLQLDMLALWDDTEENGAVVIGAGIPAEWLRMPMRVAGIVLPTGALDWTWDGRRMQVRIAGTATPVRLGPAFPPGTPVRVTVIPSPSKEPGS